MCRWALSKQIKLKEPVRAREMRENVLLNGMDGNERECSPEWLFWKYSIKGSHPVSDPLTGLGYCCHVNRICGVGTGLVLPFGSWHALHGEQTAVFCEDKRESEGPPTPRLIGVFESKLLHRLMPV